MNWSDNNVCNVPCHNTVGPVNCITVKGISWLLEYKLQVQNHLLLICTVVKELLNGIPL